MSDAPSPPTLASRVASLADSIFGVAMTLLAYDITVPDSHDPQGPLSPAALVAFLAPKVYALALSFSVSAMYWLNQQRRLTHYYRVGHASKNVSWEFLLLFAIVLMPITTRSYVMSHTGILYGGNLTALAFLNLGLTILALRTAAPRGTKIDRRYLVMPSINAAFFAFTFTQSLLWPDMAHDLWFAAFSLPLIARLIPQLRETSHDQA